MAFQQEISLFRFPTTVKGISIHGRWTARQVIRVLKIIGQDDYEAIDITTHGDSVRWYIIRPVTIMFKNNWYSGNIGGIYAP